MCSKTGIQYSNLSFLEMDIIQLNQILNGVFVEPNNLIFKIQVEEGQPKKDQHTSKEELERGFALPDMKPL